MEIKQFTKIECRILCQIIVGHKSRVSKIANYVNKQLKTAYDKTLSLKFLDAGIQDISTSISIEFNVEKRLLKEMVMKVTSIYCKVVIRTHP